MVEAGNLLLFRELLQQARNDLCILIGLLLDFAFAHCIDLPEKPHFLQLADEGLEVLRCMDLFRC